MNWIKENWGVVAVLATGLLLAALALAFLQPREPSLPAYEYSEARTPNYQPGGGGCEPQILAAIRDNGKAAIERKRCAEAAEEYRLKSNDLVQQARTADATVAQADLTHYLARVGLLGAIGGFLTLIAASLAAYYARDAAKAARDNLNAFADVERANIVVTLQGFERNNVFVAFHVIANNLGRTAALVSAVGIRWKETGELSKLEGWTADPNPKIIPASDKVDLKGRIKVDRSALQSRPYLWLLVKTQSPLKGERALRYCFRVFEQTAQPHRLNYTVEHHDEI